MMRPDDLTPPAIVAPAEGLGELAAVANAGYEAGEDATRKGIDHYIAAGEALVKAKKLCGHGKWLEWVQKNLRFGDRQARKLMRLYRERDRLKSESDSDLTIDAAARALAYSDEDEDGAVEPPLLRPGYVYLCKGTDAAGGLAFAEIAAIPDAPDYWVSAFAFERDKYVDYCGRGIRLDGPVSLSDLAALCGFIPGPAGWQQRAYDPSKPPLAVAFDLLDRRQCQGRYAWSADIPAESREAMIQAAMKRWGVTEEPREEGSTYLGRPAH
jgi:hypothetical protein